MLRSMYSGISGLKGFQTKLDVIGNNIANVNTVGFKKGRVVFQDMMSQMTSGAQSPTANRGGINPIQVGLGSQIGAIDNIHTQGFRQATGNPLDISIQGDGYFVVMDEAGNTFYTRAGNFYLDENDNVVNADGLFLKGENGKINIDPEADSFSIGDSGEVTVVINGNPTTAGQIILAHIPNPAGLEKLGNNLYAQSVNSGIPEEKNPGVDGMGKTVASALEMSNVDLAEEFTEMIVAQRGFQANTRIITTSDEILQELVNLKR